MVTKQAPLPFQGQKRGFSKMFREVIGREENAIIVDLFGGSGLLSQIAKEATPNSRVIYNDYDNYTKRLNNIEGTNKLKCKINDALGDFKKKQKLTEVARDKVLNIIKEHENEFGYVDYRTISSCLLFSGQTATTAEELEKQKPFWNSTIIKQYEKGEYLKGVEIVKDDYKNLINDYKDKENVIFVADPPYLTTDIKSYNNVNYWRLKDYLNVLTLLKDSKFIYFTSDKSGLIELADWLEGITDFEFFKGADFYTTKSSINKGAGYTDYMIVKK